MILRSGVAIAVVVSAGALSACGGTSPAQIAVPDLAGMTSDAAVTTLCRAGFRPSAAQETERSGEADMRHATRRWMAINHLPAGDRAGSLVYRLPVPFVIGTKPAAGTPVDTGSTVVIRFGVPPTTPGGPAVAVAIKTTC